MMWSNITSKPYFFIDWTLAAAHSQSSPFPCLDYSGSSSSPSLLWFLWLCFSAGEPSQQTARSGLFRVALQTVFPAFSASCDQRVIPSFSNPHGLSLVPHKEETSLTECHRFPFLNLTTKQCCLGWMSYFMMCFNTGYYVNVLLK